MVVSEMKGKKRDKPYRMVGVDSDTLDRLKRAASDANKPLAAYLRDLSYNLTGEVPPIPDQIAEKLDRLKTEVDRVKLIVDMSNSKMYSNVLGKIVSIEPMREAGWKERDEKLYNDVMALRKKYKEDTQEYQIKYIEILENYRDVISLVDAGMLQEYDRQHPENTPGDWGYYHRLSPGEWIFVKERAEGNG